MIKRVSVLTLLGLVVGVVVGLLAVGFVEAVLWSNDLLSVSPDSRAAMPDNGRLTMMMIGVPTAGGLLVGLLSLMMPARSFHGPPEAIRSAQSVDAYMPVKSGVVSAIAAWVSLGSGASVGQYGPLVHLGASVGSWIRRLTNADLSLGTIGIACGAAAAISAAFHAPIAGLIFAREVILRHYSLRAFAPIAVSSTVAYVVAHVVLQRTPLFRIEGHVAASAYEYLVFIAIGIAGALLATVYMRAIGLASAVSRKLRLPLPLKTALAGMALGVVALQVPEVLGIGQEVLRAAMAGSTYSAFALAQILVVKLLVTAVCIGFGFAGGVFAPALLIGTVFGAFVGTGVEWLADGQQSPVAIYAVCGMVAVTSPVIGAPLTAVLIVFELTQNFDLATAAMVSVAFANLIGFRVYGRSYFDEQLRTRGFDLSLGRDKVSAQRYTIRDLVSQDYTRGRSDDALSDIRAALVEDGRSEAYILDTSGAYVGTLTLHRLISLTADAAMEMQTADRFAEPEPVVLSTGTSIWAAMSQIEDFNGESIPVVDDGELVGVLLESAVIAAYLDILRNVRQEENAAL